MPRKPLKKHRKLIYAEAQEIRLKWQNDWHMVRLAKFYGVSRGKIRRILDREILMEDDGLRPHPKFLNCENVPLILKLAKKKKPVREIAEQVGLSEWLTRKVIKGEIGTEFAPKRIRRKHLPVAPEIPMPLPELQPQSGTGTEIELPVPQ